MTETPEVMTTKFYKAPLMTDQLNVQRRARRAAALAETRLREKNRRRKLKGLDPLPLEVPAATSAQQDIDALQEKLFQLTGSHFKIMVTVLAS